ADLADAGELVGPPDRGLGVRELLVPGPRTRREVVEDEPALCLAADDEEPDLGGGGLDRAAGGVHRDAQPVEVERAVRQEAEEMHRRLTVGLGADPVRVELVLAPAELPVVLLEEAALLGVRALLVLGVEPALAEALGAALDLQDPHR